MKLRILETYNAKNSFVSPNNPDRISGNWIAPIKVGQVTLNDYMKYEKGQDANIEYMTPTEYLDRCVKDIFHGSWNKDIAPIQKYNAETITKYAEAMKNGDKFPIPYLDYTTENQEGRHRALAVIEAFGEDSIMPVLVIKETNPTREEVKDYCNRKFPNNKSNALSFYDSLCYKYFPEDVEDVEDEEEEVEDTETDKDEIDDTDFDLDSELDNVLSDMSDEEFWEYIRKV